MEGVIRQKMSGAHFKSSSLGDGPGQEPPDRCREGLGGAPPRRVPIRNVYQTMFPHVFQNVSAFVY